MQKTTIMLLPLVLVAQAVLAGATRPAQAPSAKTAYPAMAPLNQYLMSDEGAEIALARTAAPPSVSDGADVMVLRREGYATAAKGTNGFLCMVQRSWAAATDDPNFWNPRLRAPICFNRAAAKTVVPIFLMKTKLVLAGESKAALVRATASAMDKGTLPALEPGAMCYMMSKQQYLGDEGKSWHPHLMVFGPVNAEKSWGGNLPGSPVIAVNDPEERVTIFMVWVGTWSDGTPAPPMAH